MAKSAAPNPPASHLNDPYPGTTTTVFSVVSFVFGILFLCKPTTIYALKVSKITNLPSIVNFNSTYFLISNTINKTKEL